MGSLRFAVLGFPVEVQPAFLWVVAIVFLLDPESTLLHKLLLVAVFFVSVLIHELGHAVVARRTGQHPAIIIHAFGGLTTWQPDRPISRRQAIQITLAGPFFGIGLAVLSYLSMRALPESVLLAGVDVTVMDVLMILLQVNLFWSFVNLLPVLPFDGGQVLALSLGPKRRMLSATISMIVGVVAAAWFFWMKMPIAAVLFGASGVMQFLSVQRREGQAPMPNEQSLETTLNEARRALSAGQGRKALELAREVAERTKSNEQRRAATELLCWAALMAGDLAEARHAVRWLGPQTLDPLLLARVYEAEQDLFRAAECLRGARTNGDRRTDVAASLIRVLLGLSAHAELTELVLEVLPELDPDEVRQVAAELARAGQGELALRLERALDKDPGGDLTAASRPTEA